jgi:glycosyltransferase involved in cell wall biosynthesis
MKIVFINQPFDEVSSPVEKGSIPIWIYEVSKFLVRDHEVVIYTKSDKNLSKLQIYNNAVYRRISLKIDKWILRLLRLFKRFRIKSREPLFVSALYCIGYIIQIAVNLRSQKPDIVHLHNYSQFVPIVRLLNPKVRIILHMHCEWLFQLDHKLIHRRIKKADVIIGCCEYISEEHRLTYPDMAPQCKTVYNGVDISRFKPISELERQKFNYGVNILFVGRISPEKGVHTLIKAFQKIIDSFPEVRLDIVGQLKKDPKIKELSKFFDGRYFSYIQSMMSEKMRENIFFLGDVPYSEVHNLYQEGDIFVNSSYSEAFPLPIPEAMACGLPVVASGVGGAAEIVKDGETGFVVPFGNSEILAEKLVHLIRDKKIRKSMGINALKSTTAYFCWEIIARNLLKEYKRLFEQNDENKN